ncbi:hypothetical protein [Aggregatibacter sp. 2125159857]|nr:hypothetical protein [Aggregatibacter sp. 2125159857]QTO01533.1 hypothetical protein J5X96_00350 [Aggregatibacter sp. 2125159857]
MKQNFVSMINKKTLEKKMTKNNTGNSNPNWPSKTDNPSGGGRGNNPSRK